MVTFQGCFKALAALTALAAVGFAAQHDYIRQCTTNDCNSDCPRSYIVENPGDEDGLGILEYPGCTVYSGGLDAYPRDKSGKTVVWHDISEPDPGCAFVLLSPAAITDPGCGYPIGQYRHATCVRNVLESTCMWQHCCGQGCIDAGVNRRNIRGANWLGAHSSVPRSPLEGSVRTLTAYENEKPIKVHSHRPATYSHQLSRRECTGFTQERRYTTAGDTVLFGGTVRGPDSFMKSSETSVSHSTSVSATVGDPFGIVSTTVGFETTESSSTSLAYTLTLEEGQLGTASWTLTLSCVEGTFTGCGDAGDQKGYVCTAAVADNGEAKGTYATVLQS